MSELPLAVRIAAGLAATAVERARKLPHDLAELPVTAVSRAMQASMRVQQQITELAIKGDNAIALLRTPAEDPPWAVFDEDVDLPTDPDPGLYRLPTDAWTAAEATEPANSRAEATDMRAETADTPGVLPGYAGLSLASVRARLRTLDVDGLRALLAYEKAHENRPEFVRMLTNRISTVENR